MAEEKDPGTLYLTVDTTDDPAGPKVTLISTDGNLKSDAEFASALNNHMAGKSTPGFVAKSVDSIAGGFRTGLYDRMRGADPNKTSLPSMGEATGGWAGSNVGALLSKLGIVSPQTEGAITRGGATGGRAVGDVIGQQLDTPADVGMAAGTAVGGLAAKPIIGTTGELLKSPLLMNMLKSGLGGAVGGEGMELATGEQPSIIRGAQEFATAALATGVQGVASQWLTKFLKPETGTKVATEMMDAIKEKYPTLVNDPNAFAIANSRPGDISKLTSMMSKALRGDADDEAATLVATLKTTLPSTPTVAQQATLRASARRLISAQTEVLDNYGDDVAYKAAIPLVQQRTDELLQTVRDMYPKVKKIDPAIVRVEAALAKHGEYVSTFKEGAEVLHHLKMSGAAEKFDPMEFGQRIRGEYSKNPGSLLNKIGNILGQGEPLQNMPLKTPPVSPAQSSGEWLVQSAKDVLKGAIPGAGMMSKIMTTHSTPTPWGITPLTAANKVRGFGAQEAGQAAMKAFLSKREQPEGSVDVRINP